MYSWLLNPVLAKFQLHHNYIQLNVDNMFSNFYNTSPIGYSFASWLSIILCAFLFNSAFNKIKILANANFLPSFIFCFLFLLNKQWWGLHVHYILMLIGMYVSFASFKFASLTRPKSTIFNLGIFIGIAGILWFPAHFLMLVVFAAFIRLRAFNIKEYLLFLLGIIMPYYIVIAILYLTNNTVHIGGFLPAFGALKFPIIFKTTLWLSVWGFIALLTIIGVFIILNNNSRQVMLVKTTWGLIFFNFIILLLILLSSLNDGALLTAILVWPIATIHCAFYLIPKQTRFANICIYATIGLIIINAYFVK